MDRGKGAGAPVVYLSRMNPEELGKSQLNMIIGAFHEGYGDVCLVRTEFDILSKNPSPSELGIRPIVSRVPTDAKVKLPPQVSKDDCVLFRWKNSCTVMVPFD